MFRLVSLTFEGERRWSADVHPHEAPATMTAPLVVLALLSVVGGFVGIPASLSGGNAIEQWLEPVFERANDRLTLPPHSVEPIEYVLMALSVAIALGGIMLARSWYLKRRDIPERIEAQKPVWYTVLLNKYYVDEIYEAAIVTPTVKGSEALLWKIIDVRIIDWLVNAVAKAFAAVSKVGRLVQTGVAQNYVFIFLLGVVAVLGWLIAK
jgi:NADH-quinone oxidoreductase subunit L